MKKVLALAGALLVAGSASAAVINWTLNMNVQIGLGNFVPGTDQVVVRGYFNGWGGTNPTLTDPDNDGIYTGSFDQGAFAGPYEYKYVIMHTWGDEWEWVSNRPYTYSEPTIDLPMEYFNNVTALPGVCDVEPTFSVDMGVQLATGAFDPGAGDIVVIRGPFNGWGGTTHQLTNVGGSIYEGTFPFDDQAETSPIEHKFVIVSGGGDNWESSPNRLSYADCDWVDTDSNGYLNGSFPTVFFGDISWDAIIDHPITVNFHIDASRVSCAFANGWAPVFDGIAAYSDVDFISVHGFFNNWPAWDGNINPIYRAENLGACQWLVSVTFPTGSAKNQIYKFGLNGYDNEAGFGQDHSVNLDGVVESFFDVFVEFGSNGSQWDCFDGCVETVDARETPSSFALAQNVPNPFNPATTLSFTLDRTANASLKVYDLSGAQVATLVNGLVEAGTHEVVFDGSKLASGVYVYTLQSEGAVESRKMVLVK